MTFDEWLLGHAQKRGYRNTRLGHEHKPSITALAAALDKSMGSVGFKRLFLQKTLSGERTLTAIEARHLARLLDVDTDELVDRYEAQRKIWMKKGRLS